MTDEEIINNAKYHTCGRCKHNNTPDGKYPCISCIYGPDRRTDLWELEQRSEYEHDHDIMKAYNNGQAYVLDILRKELELIGANEQETNGKTDYLKGITACLDIIDKYREGFILPLPDKEREK